MQSDRCMSMVFSVFSAATIASSFSPCVAADWPQWRGVNRDGLSTETGWQVSWPENGPAQLWRESVGEGYSGVSVVGERVYTVGNTEGILKSTDSVWCLDATTGKTVWKYSYSSKPGAYPGPRSTPTIDGDALFTLSRHGELFCLDVADGGVKWQKDLRNDCGIGDEPNHWGLACSPLIVGDTVILDLGKVLVLNKTTGDLLFAMGDDAPGFSSPVLLEYGDDQLVTSFNGFGLVLYSLTTQKAVGRYEWPAKWRANTLTPVVCGDRIFVSSGYGKGCALVQLKADGLSPVYRNDMLSSECHTPVLYEGHLYGVSGVQGRKGELLCMDVNTGELKWKREGFYVGGGVIIADGKIIHMEDKGQLVVAEASSSAYKELARATVLESYCWAPPVLANGRIYCRNSKGTIVCLDVRGQ